MADAAHVKIEDNPKILSGPVLTNSPNAVLSKTLLNRYNDLPLPADKILATYVWIDGTGEHLRCKDRTLNFIPKVPKEKLANLLEELTQHYRLQAQKNIKGQYANQYSAPYFFPKDLEGIYDVGCELKEQQNRDSFDENFKGFIAIVEM